jgi:hypothetical protein
MSVSRKDFELIAEAFAESRDQTGTFDTSVQCHAALCQWEADCRAIAVVFKGLNSRFDRSRFLAACGVKQ